MADKINNIKDLDPTKVKAAVDKFWVDKVNQTLTDRWIEWAKAPAKTDISTETETTDAIVDQVPVQQPTDTEQLEQTPPTQKDQALIPWVNAPSVTPKEGIKTETKVETKTEEPKVKDEVLIPWVNAPEIVKSQQELQAEQKWYSFKKDDEGIVSFTPKNLDEALSLYEDFWTNVKIDWPFSSAKSIYNSFSKYKNAPESVYLQWFKTNDIWVSWETWDRLVSLNWWQPTAAMLAAQKQYDDSLKVGNVNNTINIANGTDVSLNVNTAQSTLQQLDTAFTSKMNQLFWDVTTAWDNHKNGNEKITEITTKTNDLASQLDELNIEKRSIIDSVKERNPNLPLSQQLLIADDEIDAIDDQLFVLQRDYNNALSTLKFETEKANADFEQEQKQIDTKMKFIEGMYWIARGDIIRQEDIVRADRLLDESIKREEKKYQQSVKDNNKLLAKEQAYKLAYLKEQAKINNEFWLKTVWNRAFKWNKETQDWEEIPEGWEGTVPTITPTWKITQTQYTTPYWTTKTVRVDQAAQDSLNSIIEQLDLDKTGVVGWISEPGDTILIWDTYRSKEEQQKLYDAYQAWTGWLAAKPWTSAHEKWLAIDIYANSNFDALNPEQVKIMNDNWWFQTAWAWDLWHFEYLWKRDWWNEADFVWDSLAKNNAIALHLWETSIADIKKLDKETQRKVWIMWDAIKTFIKDNQDVINLYRRLVWWDTSKTSDKEQIMKFNNAIAEWALNWWDTTMAKVMIRDSLLSNKDVWDKVEAAVKVDEQINVIKDLFKWVESTWLTTAFLNKVAKTVWDELWQKVTAIDVLSWKILADYVKSISWVAVSEEEYQRLAKQLPSLKDNPKRFLNILNTFKKSNLQTWSTYARLKLRNPITWELDDSFFYEIFPEFRELNSTDTKTKIKEKLNQIDNYTDSILKRKY